MFKERSISKKILVILITTLFLVSMMFFVSPGKIFGATLTVGSGGYATIQEAITAASDGDTINVEAGTYTETGQIVINKNLTIIGAGSSSTIIKPSVDTGNSGDSRGWFLVNLGKSFTLKNVTLDGSGHKIYQGIRSLGTVNIQNNIIKNILYEPSGSAYGGMGIAVMGSGSSNILDNTFTNIGRIGVIVFGSGTQAQVKGNTYTGKGAGNWLDYGVEVGGGGNATISDNTISNCLGVANVDGSTSAGILVTTYYGSGTSATITENTISNNTTGIMVGYNGSDTSTVVAHQNNITGNTYGIESTNPIVDAINNWWGDASGPFNATTNPIGKGNAVSDKVNFNPWLTNPVGYVAPVSTPPRPLTAEEQAALNLSLAQQVDLYGASATGFVKMLYDNILGRAADSEGLNDWVTALNNGMMPSEVAFDLVFSDELKSKISSMSSEEFVTFLYKNVFNRQPDSEGYAGWLNAMNDGMSKEEVLIHFLDSTEFKDICIMFGLE